MAANSSASPNRSEIISLSLPWDDVPRWLAARARLQRNWSRDVLALQERTRDALQTSPEFREAVMSEVGDANAPTLPMLEAAFATCLRRATARGEGGRALLGGYANAALRRWDAILTAWRANNLYLVPVAWRLTQLLRHDAPALRHEVHTLGRAIADAERKAAEKRHRATVAASSSDVSARALGVEPEDYAAGLDRIRARICAHAAAAVPGLLGAIMDAARAQSIQDASALYLGFTAFVHGQCGARSRNDGSGADEAPEELLPTLRRFSSAASSCPLTSTAKAPLTTDAQKVGAIDESVVDDRSEWVIEVVSEGNSGIERGTDGAYAGVDNAHFDLSLSASREAMLDDAAELRAFLAARIAESLSAEASQNSGGAGSNRSGGGSGGSSTGTLVDTLAAAPAALSNAATDVNGLRRALADVDRLAVALTDTRLPRCLALAAHDVVAVDAAVDSFEAGRRSAERAARALDVLELQRTVAAERYNSRVLALESATREAAALRDLLEADVSKLLNVRVIMEMPSGAPI